MKKIISLFLILFLFVSCKKKTSTENQQNGNFPGHDTTFIYIAGKKYSFTDLKKLTRLELMLMEAELFARFGILKGNKWQKHYIKFKNWFTAKPNASEENISALSKGNLAKFQSLIRSKNNLVINIKRPENLRLKTVNTILELTGNNKILKLKGKISESDWNILRGREFGQEEQDTSLKMALSRIEGFTGFYKVFVDNKNRIRVIENYSGCCGVILGKKYKELYIFNENGNLIKLSKFSFGKKDATSYYFYNTNKLSKKIGITYSLKTGQIIEVDITKREN